MSRRFSWSAVAAVCVLLGLMMVRSDLERRTQQANARFQVDREAPGYPLYQRLGCHRCHGILLQGTLKAPPLWELAHHYDTDGLLRYLDNPDSAQIVDSRPSRLDAQFPKHDMPSFPLRVEAAQTLLNFLLAPSSTENADVDERQNLPR